MKKKKPISLTKKKYKTRGYYSIFNVLLATKEEREVIAPRSWSVEEIKAKCKEVLRQEVLDIIGEREIHGPVPDDINTEFINDR